MITEVVLVIIGHDLQQQTAPHFLLTTANELPNAPLTEKESTLDVAQRLLMDYTGLSALIAGVGWVELKQLPVSDSVTNIVNGERVLSIPFVCVVPIETPIDAAKWVEILNENQELSSVNHLEILVSAWNAL